MTDITFTPREKEAMTKKIQEYCREELEQDLSRFEAEFLLEFFKKEIGGFFYNRGLYDAQAIVAKRVEELSESIVALEKETGV